MFQLNENILAIVAHHCIPGLENLGFYSPFLQPCCIPHPLDCV